MCKDFGALARQLDLAFVYVKRRDRTGFDAQLRSLSAMVNVMTSRKTVKHTCEYCDHATVTPRNDLLCTCEGARRENELVGAAETCDKWKLKG